MKKPVVLVLVALALLLAWVAAGPFITIHQIRDAVRSGDREALAEQVDFPQLRENLKVQLDDRLADELPASGEQGVFASFGRLIAGRLVDVAVDALITPASLARMMSGERVDTGRSAHEPPPEPARGPSGDGSGDASGGGDEARREPLADASYHFAGPGRFIARITSRDGRVVDFVLTRDGLRWRLTNIVLPL